MIRGLIRLMLVAIVLVAAAFFFFGYWSSGRFGAAPASEVGAPQIDTAAVREAGTEIGQKAATVAARVGKEMEEGGLTAKIKAKMVLDDLVQARTINVTTEGTTVTLTGTVHSQHERNRSLALARETDGVTQVIDRLTVQ